MSEFKLLTRASRRLRKRIATAAPLDLSRGADEVIKAAIDPQNCGQGYFPGRAIQVLH